MSHSAVPDTAKQPPVGQLQHTPLYAVHVALGAKMVPFAGFEMPVHYPTGITAEHRAVREYAGVFDVSHMGEFEVRGPQAVEFVNYVTSNDVAALAVGQVHYTTILNDRGTIEDDCLVYRFADRLMMVVNASNRAKDFAHISKALGDFDCTLADISDDVALLAIQGPEAARIVQRLTGSDLARVGYYHFTEDVIAGVPAVISRTGYTGEDGFELYVHPDGARVMWEALTIGGDVTPAGLGSRDTLRLEAGMALYGHEIDDTTTPYEANLGWLVKLAKGDFVGRAALAAQKERGVSRRIVGFVASERCIPRQGYPAFVVGAPSGDVRSGAMSPTLGQPIGTCFVPRDSTAVGTGLAIVIRDRRIPAAVVALPFYSRRAR